MSAPLLPLAAIFGGLGIVGFSATCRRYGALLTALGAIVATAGLLAMPTTP